MFYRAEEKTIQVFGSPMTYVSFGRGVKQLVIIPGLSLKSIHGSAPALAWMYRLFSEEYRVYVFDKKEALPEPCTANAFEEDVRQCLSAGMNEHLSKPVNIEDLVSTLGRLIKKEKE